MDITEENLIAQARKVDENSFRVKLVLFIAKNFVTGVCVALGLGYLLTSAMGFLFELVGKDPSYKLQAVVGDSLFFCLAGYVAALQILVKKLAK